MLDRDGFRPNVGIILLNQKNQVFWGKRIRTHSWQFPQGGIDRGETPEQAARRELQEETGVVAPELTFIRSRQGMPGRAQEDYVFAVEVSPEVAVVPSRNHGNSFSGKTFRNPGERLGFVLN